MTTADYTLIQGDATDRATLPAGSADLLITSPPYNLGKAYTGTHADDQQSYPRYLEFTACWLSNALHWTRDTGRLCLNIPLDTSSKRQMGPRPVLADVTTIAMRCGWNYHATIVWHKTVTGRRCSWGSWLSASAPHIAAPVEAILVMHKGNWKRNRRGDSKIDHRDFMDWVHAHWQFSGALAKQVGHEAPFPRELPRRCIQLFSYLDDIVLDPFCGSGTTLIEALDNGRGAIGIEKEPNYCVLTRQRIAGECHKDLFNLPAPRTTTITR